MNDEWIQRKQQEAALGEQHGMTHCTSLSTCTQQWAARVPWCGLQPCWCHLFNCCLPGHNDFHKCSCVCIRCVSAWSMLFIDAGVPNSSVSPAANNSSHQLGFTHCPCDPFGLYHTMMLQLTCIRRWVICLQRVPNDSSIDWYLNKSSCAVVSCYWTPSTISSIVGILLCPTAYPSSRCPSGLFAQFLQMLNYHETTAAWSTSTTCSGWALALTNSHRQLPQLRYSAQNNTASTACVCESTNNGQRLPWLCGAISNR